MSFRNRVPDQGFDSRSSWFERQERRGEKVMRHRRIGQPMRWLVFAAVMILVPVVRAQDDSASEKKGIDSGNYNIQQTIEAGYRADWINGNMNTYNTFINLGEGVRLLDYTLDMRSLDHNGLVFDTLNFSNFGYGGDPDNVTRLRIQKNKLYDFRYLFRRDKNFWDWSLLTNPLNSPIAASPTNPNPNTVLITSSPHSLDLVRRMQDFDVTLFPLSKLRFRLGYDYNVDEGPSLTSLDGATEPILNQAYRVTTNTYHIGADIRYLPKTTISYDQFFKTFKNDTFTFDAVGATTPFSPLFPPGFNQYQLANHSPVDLGAVWITNPATGVLSTPCAAPVIAPASTPPTVKSTCNGFYNGLLTLPASNGLPAVDGTLPAYSLFARPRNFMPTERISFQSGYFQNLQMSGSFAYTTGDTVVNDFLEAQDFFATRTINRGSLTNGPAKAKQYSATADFMAVYSINDKLRVRDVFRFDNWRIPGVWTSFALNFTAGAVAPGGPTGMLAPISTVITDPATFTAACPTAPYNQLGCPQHSASSVADFANQFWQRTLSEDTKSNTIQLEYDFNKRISARAGFLYTNRKIGDFNAQTDLLEIYLPGGAGNAGNLFLAARADCALVGGVLPADCILNPATGVITEKGPEASNDTSVNITDINQFALLLGVTARPIDKLRITGDFQFGSNDNAFVRPDARNFQVYKVHATYRPTTWASVDGSIDIHENRNNVFTVNDLEHDRSYSFTTTLAPNPKLAVDFGYTYLDFFANIDVCYASGLAGQPTTLCPIINPGDSGLGATSIYSSTDHFVFADLMWKPYKRVTVTLGYAGNFTRGTSNFFNQPQFGSSVVGSPPPALAPVVINANTPSGTLNFNYLKPYGSIAVDIYKGLSYKVAWNYYGFNEKGPADPATLSAIGARDFNGNTATFSFRYSF
jgi:hypothetical protein